MKKLLLGTVGFAALIAGPAMAADLSVRPVYKIPVAVWSWTGLYVGLNTGGSIGSGSTTNTGVGVFPGGGGFGPPESVALWNESFRHSPTGWIFGGQIGYNQQVSSWVFGGEVDWQWTSQKDTVTVGGCGSPGQTVNTAAANASLFPNCVADEQKLTNFGTARARAGVVVNDSLWYVTGGAAWATVKDSYTYNSSATSLAAPVSSQFLPGAAAFSHTKGGWTIGAGVETRLFAGWTAKVEYLYVDLGTVTDTFGVAVNPAFVAAGFAPAGSALSVASSSRVTDHIVRVGLNYKIY